MTAENKFDLDKKKKKSRDKNFDIGKKHKFSLNEEQIVLLDELMDADRKDNGICYQNKFGEYSEKENIDFLKSIGFITEFTSEKHVTATSSIVKKCWTITYHGIAFLFAYHTLKG